MKSPARTTASLLSITIIFGSILGVVYRQSIFDYFALRNYTPNQRIVALADDTTMNGDMRRVFYINHPELNDKPSFRQNCIGPGTEESIVLGCYEQHKGIFLLDVTDERLDGVMQVTAAHEALHAEYDRLSGSERSKIDKMTGDFFANLKNERIKETIEQYRARDAEVVPSELHSILGTEVRQLSPDLETYYSKYFEDRAKIVEFSERYEQTFVELSEQVETYDNQLNSLKETIESNRMEIEAQDKEIEAQKARLESLLNSDKTAEYNAAVPEFNAFANSYNALLSRTKQLIEDYNDIVAKRNQIATTEQELVEAIDSNSVPKQAE